MKIAYINMVVSSTTFFFFLKENRLGFLYPFMWWALQAQGVDSASVPAAGTGHLARTRSPLIHSIAQPRDGTESQSNKIPWLEGIITDHQFTYHF